MKKVLFMIIDAASSRILEPAIKSGRLPNLQRLYEATDLRRDSIAVFPSITPAATSSLITGCYPREHHITGMYWYDPAEHNVVYYGYDMWAILNEGPGKFIGDFLVGLNKDFLDHETLFDVVEKQGLKAASLNFLVFQGQHPHQLVYPKVLQLLPNAPREQRMDGPYLLYFGDFITTHFPDSNETPRYPGGPFHRFGFSDDSTASLLIELTKRDLLPDLTVAYFPDNDFHSHELGPENAVEKLRAMDERLGEFFDAAGGLDRLLADVCIVLTGDHSQVDMVSDKDKAGIKLEELLTGFTVADLGTPMASKDDLVVCPNLRTVQIYFHTPDQNSVQQLVRQLLMDVRIDQVLWPANLVDDSLEGVNVASRSGGQLRFWPAKGEAYQAHDIYDGKWNWEGDLRVVDGKVEDNMVIFGDYPNAFERIALVQDMWRSGHVWATAHPGYEFQLENSEIHAGGGSHGSLHVLDSLSPLWVVGAPKGFTLPQHPRAVDLVPICLSLLDIEPARPVGASHIS